MSFDQVSCFEIEGRRFAHIDNPLQQGVFDAGKTYFVVLEKNDSLAVYLWHGKHQSLFTTRECTEFMMSTSFRTVLNERKANKRMSAAVELQQHKKLDLGQ